MLKEQLMDESPHTKHAKRNVLSYVSRFKERLHEACSVAKESISAAQSSMKRQFDRKALQRSFQSDDMVLVLLPIPGSSMCARFF